MSAIFDALSEPISSRDAAGLARIGLVLRSRAWKGAMPAGVTPTQGQALEMLGDAPAGMRLGALAQALGVSAPTASDVVASLVAKGLASKAPGPDKRSVALKLTAEGEALARCAADWPDFLASAVNTLEPAEQAAFLRSLVKLIRALQESGDIPAQRMCVTCRYFRPFAHDDALAPHHCAYVDAEFGDRHLRLNCGEHEEATAEQRHAVWKRFASSSALS